MVRRRIITAAALGAVLLGAGLIAIRLYFGDSFEFLGSEETRTETVFVENENKEIMITNGVRHTIALTEIVDGCPSKDCIPSIDNPVFESVAAASDWLKDDDIGLALSYEGVNRFYPYRILVMHEIVNDTIPASQGPSGEGGNGKRVLVTYCPLCFTGIVFDPLVDGARVEFGVSGKLWNSNLLMYDRKTDTLWSQITGEAVVGERAGAELKTIRSDITKFGLWKNANPSGEVLSRKTGRPFASYERIPYGGDLTDIKPFFPVSNRDARLPETAYILGILIDGKAKAYHFDAVKSAGTVFDTFAGRTLRVEYNASLDTVDLFEVKDNGEETELTAIPAFWFSWAATYPNTELFK